jgi:hypothetical protein
MKKIIITLLVLTMVLGCVACKSDTGGKENTSPPASDSTPDNGDPDNGKDNESDKDKKPTKDITMEDLLNHPESPESDFACTGDETTGLTIVRYDGDDEVVVIPEKIRGIPVVRIDSHTFANRDDIKAIRLSDSVTELEFGAIGICTGLELFASGSGLEIIGKAAFQGCRSLREVRLNEGLMTIEGSAFGFCTSLSSVDIPASVGEMPNTPFTGMSDDFTVIVEKGSINAKDAERIAELGYIKVEYR